MSAKIFLGNAPWQNPGGYGVRAGSRWPHFEKNESDYMPFPFFLAYSSALLKENGFSVKLVDGIAEGINQNQFLDQLAAFSPDILVLEVSTISIQTDLEYARLARSLLKNGSIIIFCGLHIEIKEPSFLEEHLDIDLVMFGEYEFTLLEIARRWQKGKKLHDVLGTNYRDSQHKLFTNPARPITADLNTLPWPDRDSLPMVKYCDTPGNIPKPSVQMWASRGCPFQCVFCAWPQIMYGGHRYRVRKPELVVDEMEWLVKERGFKSVYFDDDTFNIGKPRIMKICQEIKRREINVPWAIMARADTMDTEMLHALRAAGLCALKYGIESADQSLVDRCGKGLDLTKVREIVSLTKKIGIFVHLTFTFGLPGETADTIDKTINLALELDPHSLQFSIITPFPGSKLFDDLDARGHVLSKNWADYDGYSTAVIKTDFLEKEDLEAALDRAYRSWEKHRFQKGMKQEPWQVFRRAFKNPKQAMKRLIRVLIFMIRGK
ncbi:B12-binding domain-containing radical SAM protein [candidate division CSSED10-310 bacterium]|uniref:B12-binding domain-containing radical SAM protein n=1 Tax=candidate division CSSED10-310 bacterium TaxID=2855610 RepID=A0ABV6YRN0_UNCC1